MRIFELNHVWLHTTIKSKTVELSVFNRTSFQALIYTLFITHIASLSTKTYENQLGKIYF